MEQASSLRASEESGPLHTHSLFTGFVSVSDPKEHRKRLFSVGNSLHLTAQDVFYKTDAERI